MAGIFRRQGRTVGRTLAPLLALVLAVMTNAAARGQLYDRPVLVVDPGMHTAPIASVATDLVLLDACRSASLIGGPSNTNTLPAAEVLNSVLDGDNVTVLTSSTANTVSREDEKWRHGAFTEVLLDALSGSAADTDHNGSISMGELAAYVKQQLPKLTGGAQQPGIDQRFFGDIFVAGL